ncbi:DUF2513 domain-containing protein [Pseudomonas sp. GL-RE-20]|uniref:DUF2513 domain-containing protein n=1 Tax=Pseudomonas sp. GL-RE-20 TaxID=2832372 RepID=UPI001CBE22C8|nr:DUF2513 domain-containing protein [Pseudomonas sp. GL-RE-20]
MKRNKSMVKFVLDLANMMGHAPNPEKMTINEIAAKHDYSDEQQASLFHTVRILDDRGLIVLGKPQNLTISSWTLNRLTWDGHDYLDGLTDTAQ